MKYSLKNIRGLSLVLSLFVSTVALAQSSDTSNAAAQANNPLAQKKALSFQDQYLGDPAQSPGDLNQFYLRFASPFSLGQTDWIGRITLPVNTSPVGAGGKDETAIGDLNVFGSYLIDLGNPAISFGIGPQLTLPTATDDRLGAEKWSAGFANVMFDSTSETLQWGYLLTWQASFAGNEDREDVNLAALQPFVFYQLGEGWYMRSSAVALYNFENDAYTLPLGLGLGRVIPTDKAVINFFIEPQKTLFRDGPGQSDWGVFSGLNFQF